MIAHDMEGRAVFAGDRMFDPSNGTIYDVVSVLDGETGEMDAFYSNRPERFGNQMGTTSGRESAFAGDLCLMDASRKPVQVSFQVNVGMTVELPDNIPNEALHEAIFHCFSQGGDYDVATALDCNPVDIVDVRFENGKIFDLNHIGHPADWTMSREFLDGYAQS